jgi:hypothetical protein
VLVFGLAARSLRWRAAASVTVFLVALVAIMAATVGPIYLHAVNQTVLAQRLRQAPQYQRDMYVSRVTLLGMPRTRWEADIHALATLAADPRWFAAPVYSQQAQVSYTNGTHYQGRIAAVDDQCQQVHITSGRCVNASATDETMISARTATSHHLTVGAVIKPEPTVSMSPISLHVVGIYQPIHPHGSFWKPWDLFDALQPVSEHDPPKLDAFLVGPAVLSSRIGTVVQTLAANVRLMPAKVRLDDVSALRQTIKAVQSADTQRTYREGLTAPKIANQLPAVLASMSSEMSLTRTLITLSTVQLALLAIFVLYSVVAGTTSAQAPEVALAKLRGRRPRSVLLQGVLQPVVLVLLAAPIATPLAWLLVRALSGRLLGSGVDVVFPVAAAEVAAAAAGRAVLAAIIAARRILVSPVATLLRRGDDATSSSVGLALADAAAVTLALAGLVQLIAGGVFNGAKTDPLSALAPTLLGIAGAVLVLRLLPVLGRGVLRSTRDSTRLTGFLAVRQIIRRPAGARALLLVAVALALASFAVTNWSAARTNRQLRALGTAGAWTVLKVTPSPNVFDLRQAVDRADPSGHSMAAAYATPGQGTALIAVDTHRFAGVGAWGAGNSAQSLSQVLETLRGTRPPPVAFSGAKIELAVDLTRSPPRAVRLSAGVIGADHQLAEVDFGLVHAGPGVYEGQLPADCAQGCRFTDVSLSANTPGLNHDDPNGRLGEIDATISAQAYTGAVGQPVAGFDDAARWRGDGKSLAQIGSSAGALSLVLRQSSQGGAWASLQATDVPASLPAALASGTVALYRGARSASSVGLDGNELPLNGVIRAVSLPQLDRFGAMVDFGAALQAMSDPAAFTTQFQVWLSPAAPKDMRARLAAQGVHVTGRVRASTYRAQLDHTGPAYADGLFLVAAAAATLLAIGATVLGGVITARRRAYELAALAAVGVAPRTLRRATAVEQGIVLGLGLVIGLAAGLGGSLLALPSTPFFVTEHVGPPTEHGLPWGLLAGLVGALIVVFVVTCVVVARFVSRQATAERLREAQE